MSMSPDDDQISQDSLSTVTVPDELSVSSNTAPENLTSDQHHSGEQSLSGDEAVSLASQDGLTLSRHGGAILSGRSIANPSLERERESRLQDDKAYVIYGGPIAVDLEAVLDVNDKTAAQTAPPSEFEFFSDVSFLDAAPEFPRASAEIVVTDLISVPLNPHGRTQIKTGDDAGERLLRAVLVRMDSLEAALLQARSSEFNRGHNHPPELIEIEHPIPRQQFEEIIAAIHVVRGESENLAPDVSKLETQVSVFRKIARMLNVSLSGATKMGVGGVIGGLALEAYYKHQHVILGELQNAADIVSAWVQHIPTPF